MDLSLTLNNIKLNIRVSVLLEAPSGYIFEYDKQGFYFPIGGRIKIGEDSIKAAKREIKEEIALELGSIEYISTIENFFKHCDTDYHEINIVHKAQIDHDPILPDGIIFIKRSELQNNVIKPQIISKLIESDKPYHCIVRDF